MNRVKIVWICLLLMVSMVYAEQVLKMSMNPQDEYVLITNTGTEPINLKDWVVHDHDYGKGEVYSVKLPEIILAEGEILQLQSGKTELKGKADENNRKQPGSTYYHRWADKNVWNNGCDIAYLLNPEGNLILEFHAGTKLGKDGKTSCK